MRLISEQQLAFPLDMDEGSTDRSERVDCEHCGDSRILAAEAPARATQEHLCGVEEWRATVGEIGKLLLVSGEEITSPDRERALSTGRLPVP